jgi:uncharacterized protein (DUF952 family)
MGKRIYKVVTRQQWRNAAAAGLFNGAAVDLADGYIHFSAADQLRETIDRHFSGQPNLMLVSADAERLGTSLKWETSRGGALFPHLYAPLRLDQVEQVWELPLRPDGSHAIPAEIGG